MDVFLSPEVATRIAITYCRWSVAAMDALLALVARQAGPPSPQTDLPRVRRGVGVKRDRRWLELRGTRRVRIGRRGFCGQFASVG